MTKAVCNGVDRGGFDSDALSTLIAKAQHNLWTLADYTGPTSPFPPDTSTTITAGPPSGAASVCNVAGAAGCARLCAEACSSILAADELRHRFPLANRRSFSVWTNDVLSQRAAPGCDEATPAEAAAVVGPPSPAACRTRAPLPGAAPPSVDSTFVPVTRRCTDREKRAKDLLRELAETTLREWGVDRWLHPSCLPLLPVRSSPSEASLATSLPSLLWLRVSLPQVHVQDFNHSYFQVVGEQAAAGHPQQVGPLRRINRIPGMAVHANSKAGLARTLRRTNLLDLHPETFVLPGEEDEARRAEARDGGGGEGEANWVLKPSFGGQGAGVSVHSTVASAVAAFADGPTEKTGEEFVVQRFIRRPLLLDGHKFTLRVYALVTSLSPFRMYFYDNAVAKFALDEFSLDLTAGRDAHITNAPKRAIAEVRRDENATLPRFNGHGVRQAARAAGVDFDGIVWPAVRSVVGRTVAAAVTACRVDAARVFPDGAGDRRVVRGSFQFFGIDVDLLDDWTPVLIEANVNPSVGAKVPFELADKLQLLGDTFTLVHQTRYDSERAADALVGPDAPEGAADFAYEEAVLRGSGDGSLNQYQRLYPLGTDVELEASMRRIIEQDEVALDVVDLVAPMSRRDTALREYLQSTSKEREGRVKDEL